LGELQYVRANRLTGRRWMGDQGEKSNDLMAQLQFGRNPAPLDRLRATWSTT
jgi:hypothetical protein